MVYGTDNGTQLRINHHMWLGHGTPWNMLNYG